MKKALVTGANGFVGSALCRALSENNVDVIAVVRNEMSECSRLENISGIRIVYADLSEYSKFSEIIPDRDIDVFYHMAWNGSAGSLRGDYNAQIDNVRYACDSVKACGQMNIKKYVFASSIMEYEVEAVIQNELTPGVNTLYSTAKLTADHMIRAIAGAEGIEYVRGIISNIYGPGETSPRLINSTIRKLLKNEHCAFTAGEQMYDFIYITDSAQAFVEIGRSGAANRSYYIGSLSPQPLKSFLCTMRDQIDPLIEIGLGEIPFNGTALKYNEFDIYALQKDTGFTPIVSFEEGIRNTIEWIKEQ